jgi:hypothetical protein
MTAVERLFAEYKEAFSRPGGADPSEYLSQVSGAERATLEALIDAYLERAPRRPFDADAFRDSRASPVAETVHRSLTGVSGLWPTLLPQLRNRAQVRRAEVVAQLAARLGAQSQREKVSDYYHEMEQGRLPADGVSDTVLDALGRIIGSSADALRRAGRMPGPGGAPAALESPAFTRTTRGARDFDAEAIPPAPAAEAPAEWDEVDRLFRGG